MLKLIKLTLWLLIITGGVFFWQYHNFVTQKVCINYTSGYLEVKKGDTFRDAILDGRENKFFTKIYLKLHPPKFELQAGKYEISCGDIASFIESLQHPVNDTDISLTFLEGWNIFDIDAYLTEKGFINAGSFITQARKHEGYLYPDTYAVNPNTFSVNGLIEKMRNNFETKMQDIIPEGYTTEQMHELITLASIVEKEEKNPSEKSTVAGILKKRLKENWMLGADITVCYAHELTAEECKLSVTKYLYEKNDYNTRQKVGLPAGPIGNPSAETIKATLYHTDTPYYYYLHDTQTGKIYYGKTEGEHNRNKQLYLR